MDVTIYILLLEEDKYYVGMTHDLDKRFNQHVNGTGSAYTKKYKPISIDHSFVGDVYDEDKYVKIYMEKYGIDNVRGGSYSNIKLKKSQICNLANEIKGATNICFKCGSSKHLSTYCKTGKKRVVKNGKVTYKRKRNCSRCGRNTHTKRTCHALTKLNGDEI
jgi:GIY-YIG catalytic domain